MKIKIHNTTKYLVFLLLLTYFSQGVLYPTGTTYAKVILVVSLLIQTIYFFLSLKYINRAVVNSIALLIILNILYYLFSSSGTEIYFSSFITLKLILYNLLFFFFSFYLSLKNIISEKNILYFYLVIFIITILNYYSLSNKISYDLEREEFTNNLGYTFVTLLPFLFLIKRKYISIIILFISLIYILLSAKRGAIIIGITFTLYYFYQEYIKNSGKKFLTNIFILLTLITIFSYILYDLFISSVYLQKRLLMTLEGNSSGRDSLYSNIFNYWLSSHDNILNYLFGFGYNAAYNIVGTYAHNDWLELLLMSGILGVGIYLSFFIQLFFFSNKSYLEIRDKKILVSILLIWILKSMFSMGYGSLTMLYINVLLGYIIGKYQRRDEKNTIFNS